MLRKPLSLELRSVEFYGSCIVCKVPDAQRQHYEARVGVIPVGWSLVHSGSGTFAGTCVNVEHLHPVPPKTPRDYSKTVRTRNRLASKRTDTFLVHGENLTWTQLTTKYKVSRSTITDRMRRGMTVDEAVVYVPPSRSADPVIYEGRKMGLNTLSDKLGISFTGLKRNIEAGMSLEDAIKATLPIRRRAPSPSSTA